MPPRWRGNLRTAPRLGLAFLLCLVGACMAMPSNEGDSGHSSFKEFLKQIIKALPDIGYYASSGFAISIAFISALSAMILLLFFVCSLRQRGLRAMTPTVKLVRISMVLLSLCDLVVALFSIAANAVDVIGKAIGPSHPFFHFVDSVLDPFTTIGTLSAFISAAFCTLCLAVAVHVAAKSIFLQHDFSHLRLYVLGFIVLCFVLPTVHFVVWFMQRILLVWTRQSDELLVVDYTILFWETAGILLICEVVVYILFLRIWLISRKAKRTLDNTEKLFLSKFRRYLIPFGLCVTVTIIFLLMDQFAYIFPNVTFILAIQAVVLLLFGVFSPLQGFLNVMVFVINSREHISDAIKSITRLQNPQDSFNAIMDGDNIISDEWRRNVLGNMFWYHKLEAEPPPVTIPVVRERYSEDHFPRSSSAQID